MTAYTLTYSPKIKGWPSFYSYEPDFMVGMNNYFYTFKQGELYRHNTNETRNNFYGTQYTSRITSIFNEAPLSRKLFKTLNLESDESWDADLETDIQDGGIIEKEWFEKKEQSWYAFIRSTGTVPASEDQYELRSLNGIGRSQAVNGSSGAREIDFALTIRVGTIISVGDYLYFSEPPYDTPQLAGQVTAINVDLPNSTNQIVIDDTIPNAVTPIPISDAYYLFIKDARAESLGLLGHYCKFTLTNSLTTATELFAADANIMKSFP